ncbi:MAG TPA: NAD(P)-dependent oxidoreductase [Allosphingosinicella sp.]|nr:NAD(P)-dependent oxidoreductase [Allosphingosinicella sp.]
MIGGRVLLTGGTGFVGRAILAKLLDDGREVLAFTSGGEPDLRHPKLEWRRFDLLRAEEEDLGVTLGGEGLSHCIHAAWYTNHADYLVHEVNREWVSASLRLHDAFIAAGGRRFVGIGTCIEYGSGANERPCREYQTPLRPYTLYGECKVALFRALEARGGGFAWARIFFVYGPGDRDGRLVPYILSAFARGEEAGPNTGGLRRDFIHVEDLALQIVRIADSGVQGAINTGTGAAVTISEIFETAADLYGRPELARANADMGQGQPLLIEADLTRFRRDVGEPATRSLRDGLAELVRAQR